MAGNVESQPGLLVPRIFMACGEVFARLLDALTQPTMAFRICAKTCLSPGDNSGFEADAKADWRK